MVLGAAEIGVDLTAEQVELFMEYLKLLQEWNQKFNLTAITDPEEIIAKHFLDSILLGSYVPEKAKLADIGTGAGFPGIPLKIIHSGLQVTLIDSLGKRVNFVREVVSRLNLTGVQTIHGRAEDLGRMPAFREGFEVVAARAVSSLSVLSEYCLPLVKLGGLFIAAKGPSVEEEINQSKGALDLLGGSFQAIKHAKLPGRNDIRTVVVIEKKRPTPQQYPRKAGVPEKKPLS